MGGRITILLVKFTDQKVSQKSVWIPNLSGHNILFVSFCSPTTSKKMTLTRKIYDHKSPFEQVHAKSIQLEIILG